MSRYIRALPLRSLALQAAAGIGLLALSVAVLLLDPSGLGTLLRGAPLRPVMLLGFLAALTFAGTQIAAAMRLREQPRPVPARGRAGLGRLPY